MLGKPTSTRDDIEPPTEVTRWDLALAEWRFSLNLSSGKFEVLRAGRPDLAHLTISWRNKSESLDIHLTYDHEAASRGEVPKSWDPILSKPLSEVRSLAEAMVNGMRGFFEFASACNRKYRPGWLADRGYRVSFMSREHARHLVKEGLPRRRRKYRFEPERVLNDDLVEIVKDNQDPRILSTADKSSIAMPIFVRRPLRPGRHSADQIVITHRIGPDGKGEGWWGMSARAHESMLRRFAQLLSDELLPRITPAFAEPTEKIIQGLGLGESPETQGLARDLRAFFCDRRNPYLATPVRSRKHHPTP